MTLRSDLYSYNSSRNVSRSITKPFDEAILTGQLLLSGKKLKEYPKQCTDYDLQDTVFVDLSKNRLSDLPEEICKFLSIEKLNLHHNVIKALPAEPLVNLQLLTHLNLSRNQLSVLPGSICKLESLQVLDISGNRLVSLPEDLGLLQKLTELDASHNQLQRLPASVGDLDHVKKLNLRRNLLQNVPTELCFLHLVYLDLSYNNIGELPIEFRFMASLNIFMLDANPLTHPPANICKRGRVHIFKWLDQAASKNDKKRIVSEIEFRRSRKSSSSLSSDLKFIDGVFEGIAQRTSFGSYNGKHENGHSPDEVFVPQKEVAKSMEELNPHFRKDPDAQYPDNGPIPAYSPYTSLDDFSLEAPLPKHPIPTYREYIESKRQQRAMDASNVYKRFNKSDDQISNSEVKSNGPQPRLSPKRSPSFPLPENGEHRLSKIPSRSKTLVNNYTLNGNVTPPLKPGQRPPSYEHAVNTAKQMASKPSQGLAQSAKNEIKKMRGDKNVFEMTQNLERLNFTIKREMDKHHHETMLLDNLRSLIESRLKVSLPADFGSALMDGVVLCHLVNHVSPRAVSSIHVPSPAAPKLTIAKCRLNVEHFLDACRKVGVEEAVLCSCDDIVANFDPARVLTTVHSLLDAKRHLNLPKITVDDLTNPMVAAIQFTNNKMDNIPRDSPHLTYVLLTILVTTLSFLYLFLP